MISIACVFERSANAPAGGEILGAISALPQFPYISAIRRKLTWDCECLKAFCAVTSPAFLTFKTQTHKISSVDMPRRVFIPVQIR